MAASVSAYVGLLRRTPSSSFASPRERERDSTSLVAAGVTGTLRCLIAGLFVLTLTAGHVAAVADEPLDLRYRFTWAGVPIARFGLRHFTDAVIYQTELEIETTGLADQLFGFRSMSHATGPYQAPDRFAASRFRSASVSHRKSRRILIRFDPVTGDVIDLQMTRSGEPDRSKVPEPLQKGVTDPLTALVQLRHRLAAPEGTVDRYAAAVFDGRRRFDLSARAIGRDQAEIAGRARRVIRVEIRLKWLAGSNRDEMEPAQAGDDTFRLELLLSDDERLIPLRLMTLDSLFTAKVEIMPECLGPQGCQAVSG
jgi:Protein of unknown function (DUF3108)